MRKSHRGIRIYFGVLFTVAVALMMSDRSTATRSGTELALPADGLRVEDIVGTWSGTWNDTVYSVGGSLQFDVVGDGVNYNATGTIGMQAFAMGDMQGTAMGVQSANAIAFSFSATSLGNGGGGIDLDAGVASGTGTVSGSLNFGDFVFSGTIAGDVMSGFFNFISPSGGKGVATLSRTSTAVQQSEWGQVKERYRQGNGEHDREP